MKLNKLILSFLTATGIFLLSCNKDSDVFVPDAGQVTGPDTNWVASIGSNMPVMILENNLRLETHLDSIEVNSNIATVNNTTSGLICNFSPNCCQKSNGTAVTGKVYVELLLLKKKGDMVRMAKPTTSNGRLLVTGGCFFIKLKKDGEELQLKPNAAVQVKYTEPQTSPLMKVFYGDESNPAQFNWLPSDTGGIISPVTAGNQFYELYSKNLRWVNCDYFYDTTGAVRTKVQTELPNNYTNTNTIAYLVFNDLRIVVKMNGDHVIKKFVSGKIPVGKNITVIVISKQGDYYFLGKNAVTTANTGSLNQSVPINPVKTSLNDIKAYLATL
jgi:hypothetical protein